jgi:hypothetical protein
MDRLIFTSHSAISESAVARQALVNELAKALKALRAEASSPKPDRKP